MTVRGEQQTRCGRAERGQRGVGMREHARQQCRTLFGAQGAASQRGALLQHPDAEPRRRDRIGRPPQQLVAGEVDHALDMPHERTQQGVPGACV
ncbi:hypothetical protein GCM10025863_17120 [Microbacterium suwonense]|uniref:Uncharacterized protein n=1 Tax=Microbacterium suwonense TaxID=683047 RepID=A0ABN6X4P8_9MICO|nr:hypothetical protein GCM10025863_17120 [Microbacterium suwonense]